MKSPSAVPDDCDDIFGPPRTYATGFCTPKQRPSMISAKYRAKEERRKVLKISLNKLKKIDDPEASLCRSVLINNTVKRLQKEARDEKIQKQQLNYPRCYDNDSFLNLKTEFMKNEMKGTPVVYEDVQSEFISSDKKLMESLNADFAIEHEVAADISALGGGNDNVNKNLDVLDGLVEENLSKIDGYSSESVSMDIDDSSRFSSRKRSFDDMEDCDVQDVLSQFYMPPTPRMLTCIDDDEDVNVVDIEPSKKKSRNEEVTSLTSNNEPLSAVAESLPANLDYDVKKQQEDFRLNYSLNNNIPEAESRLARYLGANGSLETETNSYSCGHASMFNELQNNVFHNLIASLET